MSPPWTWPYTPKGQGTILGTLYPTLVEWCVGSLMSHIGLINMEDIVRWDGQL